MNCLAMTPVNNIFIIRYPCHSTIFDNTNTNRDEYSVVLDKNKYYEIAKFVHNVVNTPEKQNIMYRIVAAQTLKYISTINKDCNTLTFAPRHFGVYTCLNDTLRLSMDMWLKFIYLHSPEAGVVLKNELNSNNVEFFTMNKNKIKPIKISWRNNNANYTNYSFLFARNIMFIYNNNDETIELLDKYHEPDTEPEETKEPEEEPEIPILYTYKDIIPSHNDVAIN